MIIPRCKSLASERILAIRTRETFPMPDETNMPIVEVEQTDNSPRLILVRHAALSDDLVDSDVHEGCSRGERTTTFRQRVHLVEKCSS